MAGMFYSLEEVCAKLNKGANEIREIVKQGRLREFRDGPNLLFKVDEIEGLLSDTSIMAAREVSGPAADEGQTEIEAEEIQPVSEAEAEPVFEAPPEPEAVEEVVPEVEPELVEEAVAEGTPEPELTEEPELEVELEPVEELGGGLEAEPSEEAEVTGELTSADTTMANKGLNVLGETDSEYKLTDDTMGKTMAASDEVSLEEIEEDVNLDSFGSGSGLLDLSLQADDTSLGGILDEIYTPEGEEGKEGGAAVAEMDAGTVGEQILAEEQLGGPEPGPAIAMAYAEPEPDAISKAFGSMLFLPLLVVIYTMIVAVAGVRGVVPAILEGIQGLIWYIMGGAALVAIVIIAIPMVGGGTTTKRPKVKKQKQPKAKKVKKPKVKKEKKPKKKK